MVRLERSDLLGRVPVTIVTGFLGSGKTTLLNHLVTTTPGRVAALVNDFGAIDIDAALIASVADDVVQLANGCVCCTINSDLYAAAERVLSLNPPIDRIVVETTGLADPLPVGLTFLQTALRSRAVLNAIVTVVDSANFALDLFKTDAAMAQIVHGDIIILNKVDLVSESSLNLLEQRIAVMKPRARILRSIHGRVSTSILLGQFGGTAALDAGRPRAHVHGPSDDGFATCAFEFASALSSARFQVWLDRGIPREIYRAKGLVRFDDQPQPFVFQLCGSRSSFDPFDGLLDSTRLVFIGQNLNATAMERDLRWCLIS